MTAIEVRGVSKEYGTVTALDRVDLEVPEGEIFGFLGPNGAGKTTLISIFLDFVRPTAGQVEIFGHDCQQAGARARERMGVLPEGYSPYERLTGTQHVEFAIESKDADDDPIELLDRVGLREAAGRKAGGYSKGMAQRLVLAMALAGKPDLLVLDEPTTGLDPTGAKEMRTIIREEADRGATVFFSSHILGQVEAVCDRVGILNRGELVAVDTIEGLRQSLGGGTQLTVDVDRIPDGIVGRLESIAGVEEVWPDPETRQIEVNCANDAKMDVVVTLHETGVDVLNFRTEEASLEQMFVAYTGGE
jgi:ABC-2 type transport system ATP-binding protein